ncbi:sulfite exporter TauE/SafE family protein [Streptomyces triculaminicus]|uniref:Probable membrane transporter protein n=2 Tax=Streptomyces TaxID=1883 RepID=A0A939FKK6_9ACTN|nr:MULTISPECIES: sulfite exporter TauE/SafE family protein [Streptomyces]MBO0653243.1 sulfite exporter TauE/SafE family protein [Streptomyces triculaminicus]QSY48138.1 sulfite exporter TauE/SafE family protein [Streptomyces griseocarneus]
MSIWEALAILAAGIGAGTINTIVGSGTLFTFPVLLATGLPPITANVSNTVGLVTGNISGAIGYRRELRGQKRRMVRFGLTALVGGLTGAVLLLALPSKAFDAIVPVLIGLALVLIVLQPRIARALAARRERNGTAVPTDGGLALLIGLLVASTYGGYFGAAQGVLYLALMGILLHDELQRVNALKNVLGVIVNGVAALFFVFVADIDWLAVLLIAAGSTVGGQIGAKVGRRLPPTALRAVIVVVGIVAIVQMLLK